METFLIRALQLILSLSILVVLHEFGHFGFARLFKVRVDKFYVFFHPKYSLLRAKKIKGKWRFKFFAKNVPANERIKLDESGNPIMEDGKKPVMEPIPLSELPEDDWRKYPESTEWGIGWLPLGGYCKISGMVDESMDKTQMAQPPQPWEFRSRPVLQRLLIITGGVLVNFILALIIYAAVLGHWGREYIPLENARYGMNFSQTMIDAGFRDGDKIVTINGEKPNEIKDAIEAILIDYKRNVVVERDGKQVEIDLPADLTQKALSTTTAVMNYRYPFVLEGVAEDSPAAKAKLQKGDSVVAVNDKAMNIYQNISQELKLSKNSTPTITYVRNGVEQTTQLKIGEDGKLGVFLKSPLNYIATEKEEYGFFASIPAGIKFGWDTLVGYIKQFKLVFTPEGAKSMGGFGTIGSLFPPMWDWQTFWNMTAFLSIILAFMNILPIPGLDGGYALFLIYELITRRKPSEKFMETAVMIGFLLLLLLVIYANGNDIVRAFTK